MSTIESTELRRTTDGGWVRYVHYVERDALTDRVHLASRDDDTPTFTGPYALACAGCWLGHAHSVARHELLLVRA